MQPEAPGQNEDRLLAEGLGAAEEATGQQSADRLTVYERRRRKKKQQDAQARGFERMERY